MKNTSTIMLTGLASSISILIYFKSFNSKLQFITGLLLYVICSSKILIMNSKFLVIDMMGSSGHVSFNTWYLNQKVFNKSIFMSNKKLQKDYPEINIADIGSFKENISAKKRFYFTINALKKILFYDSKKIIFLSYDLRFFFLIAITLKIFGKSIITVEHNTVPIKFLQKVFQFFISLFVQRIVFSENIKSKFLIKKNIEVIPHPFIKPNKSIKSQSVTIESLKI